MTSTAPPETTNPDQGGLTSLDGTRIGLWCPARLAMEVDFTIARALRSGTTGMRSLGTVLLPRDWREVQKPQEYIARLLRTFLLSAYDRAVEDIAARPFQREVQVAGADKLPETVRPIVEDVDRQRMSLTTFAQRLLEMAIDRGVAHVLIDSPDVAMIDEKGARRQMTMREQRDLNVRPYFSLVSADNLVNWGWRRDQSGLRVLAFVCIYEFDDGIDPTTLMRRSIERIRYFSDTEWQVWERLPTFVPIASGATNVNWTSDRSLLQLAHESYVKNMSDATNPYKFVVGGKHELGRVPMRSLILAPYGPDPLQARPAMIDLAWKNIEHWQSSSERNNILHWVGTPILRLSGVDDPEEDRLLGAGAMIASRDYRMTAGYVEPEGPGLGALKERQDELREEMAGMANEPFVRQAKGDRTATGDRLDEGHSQTVAQSWVEKEEKTLYDSVTDAAAWAGESELHEDVDVTCFREFGVLSKSREDVDVLKWLDERKMLPKTEVLHEVKRRGWIRQSIDVDAALEEAEAEAQEDLNRAMAEAAGTPGTDGVAPAQQGAIDDEDDEVPPAKPKNPAARPRARRRRPPPSGGDEA